METSQMTGAAFSKGYHEHVFSGIVFMEFSPALEESLLNASRRTKHAFFVQKDKQKFSHINKQICTTRA